MSSWERTTACRSRVHCRPCRERRPDLVKRGAPDVCKYGVTLDTLPKPGSVSQCQYAGCTGCSQARPSCRHPARADQPCSDPYDAECPYYNP
jgi:hypothetical protein